jgi:hypothetical protein
MKNIFILILLFPALCFGEVLFTDDFEGSFTNVTVAQGIAGSSDCTSGDCGIGSWSIYRNAGNLCASGVTGRPGNNNYYINSYAGYPDEENACYGGSGKCWTHWTEACQTYPTFDDADMLFVKKFASEYSDTYLKFHIRFKSGYGHIDEGMFKLYHIYHTKDGDSTWDYHHTDVNMPMSSGGVYRYSTTMYLYAGAYCINNLSCHNVILWPIGNTTNIYQSGGLFDGDWHSVVFRVKANTSIGATDGLVEAWIDGNKKTYESGYSGTGIEFSDSGTDLRGFNVISIGGNNRSWLAGGAACSTSMDDCEQWYAIDNVRMATTYADATSDGEDTTAPTIVSVNSDKANGSYKAGEVIDIDVTFSENVTSTGNVTVTCETGDTDRTCTFTVTNASTGTCNYTVQAGDTSADLNCAISGTIADQSSNAMSNFTPTTALSANKALVIDTTAPTVSGFTIPSTSSSLQFSVSSFTCSGANYYLVNEVSDTPSISDAGWVASAPSSYTASGTGEHTLYAWCKDTAGNISSSANDTITVSSGISKAPFIIQ